MPGSHLKDGDAVPRRIAFHFYELRRPLIVSPDLGPAAALLHGILKYHDGGFGCYPSDEKLAQEAGTTVPRIRNERKKLIATRLIDYNSERDGDNYHLLPHTLLEVRPRSTDRTTAPKQQDDPASPTADTAFSSGDPAKTGGDPAKTGGDPAKLTDAYKEEESKEQGKTTATIDRGPAEYVPSPEELSKIRAALTRLQPYVKTAIDDDVMLLPMLVKGYSEFLINAAIDRISRRLQDMPGTTSPGIDTWNYIVRSLNREFNTGAPHPAVQRRVPTCSDVHQEASAVSCESRSEPPTAAIDDSSTLVTQLTARGIDSHQALRLLRSLVADQPVQDQLEYGDYLILKRRSSITNAPGFYVYLLRNNILPPPNFETSAQRAARKGSEEQRAEDCLRWMELENDYDAYCREKVRAYFNALGEQQRQEILAAKMYLVRREWRHLPTKTLEEMATNQVERELRSRVGLPSLDEFAAASWHGG